MDEFLEQEGQKRRDLLTRLQESTPEQWLIDMWRERVPENLETVRAFVLEHEPHELRTWLATEAYVSNLHSDLAADFISIAVNALDWERLHKLLQHKETQH